MAHILRIDEIIFENNDKSLAQLNAVKNGQLVTDSSGNAIAINIKVVSGSNTLSDTIPADTGIFIPVYTNKSIDTPKKEWYLISITPKVELDMMRRINANKITRNILDNLKAKQVEHIGFNSSGFPHRGPAINLNESKFEANVFTFSSKKLEKIWNYLDSTCYVYGKSNALTGIASLDQKICWTPVKNILEK